MTTEPGMPLDWRHAVRDIPTEGLGVERSATADERQAIAARLEILSVERLTATYRLAAAAGGAVRLKGRIRTALSQACVVTLDPVPETIDEPFEALFQPEGWITEERKSGGADVDLDAPETETIENGTVDVGRVVLEELSSCLDPYPRAPEATLDVTEAGPSGALSGPFAGLASLKQPKGST